MSKANPILETANALSKVLDGEIASRNTFSLTEFLYFKPLFMEGGLATLGHESYKSLCSEWNDRISTYHEVTIVDDSDNVLLTLPAIHNTADVVNRVSNRANELMSFLSNAITRNHPLRTDVEDAANILSVAFDKAEDKDRITKSVAKYSKTMDQFDTVTKGGATDSTETGTSADTSDLEWE